MVFAIGILVTAFSSLDTRGGRPEQILRRYNPPSHRCRFVLPCYRVILYLPSLIVLLLPQSPLRMQSRRILFSLFLFAILACVSFRSIGLIIAAVVLLQESLIRSARTWLAVPDGAQSDQLFPSVADRDPVPSRAYLMTGTAALQQGKRFGKTALGMALPDGATAPSSHEALSLVKEESAQLASSVCGARSFLIRASSIRSREDLSKRRSWAAIYLSGRASSKRAHLCRTAVIDRARPIPVGNRGNYEGRRTRPNS